MTSKVNWKSIRKLQFPDHFYDELFQFLTKAIVPSRYNTNRQVKYHFRKQYLPFRVQNNEIYLPIHDIKDLPFKIDPSVDIKLPHMMLVVKESKVNDTLNLFYSNINAYRSTKAFYDRISRDFIGISKSRVEAFISQKEVAQITSAAPIPAVLKPITTKKSMQQLECDLVDMSNFSSNNGGINFLLTVIDTHSKWAWVKPLKNKEAKTVVGALKSIFHQEGPPEVLSHDRGGEFLNEDMNELVKLFDFESRSSSSFMPTSQGQCERYNGVLKQMIFRYQADNDTKEYVSALEGLVFSYNSQKHNTTKFSPFELFRKRARTISLINRTAYSNITKAAQKMIDNSLKKAAGMKEELEVGDRVRILLQAFSSVRKNTFRKAKSSASFTKSVFTVFNVNVDEKGIQQYSVIPDDAYNEKDEAMVEDRLFYRYQLLKINVVPERKEDEKRDNEDEIYFENSEIQEPIEEVEEEPTDRTTRSKARKEREQDEEEEKG